jgi:hypothetical protein
MLSPLTFPRVFSESDASTKKNKKTDLKEKRKNKKTDLNGK